MHIKDFMAKFNISVDRKKCIGCGACISVCDVFELKNGTAVAKENPTEKECVKEAKDVCPVEAIEVEEAK